MNNTTKSLINKIPFTLIAIIYLSSLAWDYWEFQTSPQSQLNQMKDQIESAKSEIVKMNSKIKLINDFKIGLDQKRSDVQKLAVELDSLKSSLNENLDVPLFMKTLVTEAKRVGLNVTGLRPSKEVSKEYYVENTFEFKFKGVYVQLLVFMDRLTQVQNIIRIDQFVLRPIGSSLSKYVELDGTLHIKTFHYQKSKADDLGKKEGA